MRYFFYLLLIFLALPLVFSESCPQGQSSIFVPAVVHNGGDLLVIEAITIPGDGDIYSTVIPSVGLSTQDSIKTAVNYAFKKAGYDPSTCDVFIKVDDKRTSSIDGPSAGAAISVVTYSALVNSPVRKDATLTGAVDGEGRVLAVGGVFEKSYAAALQGISYILTPRHSFDEQIILDSFSSTNITFFEINSVDQAISFLVENKPLEQKEFSIVLRELPNLTVYSDPGLADFAVVSQNMIRLESDAIDSIPSFLNTSEELKKYYSNELKRQNLILEKGYPYTAANEAFQNFISIKTITSLYSLESFTLESKTEDARTCIDSLKFPTMHPESYEWVSGAQQRQAWALQKLDSLSSKNTTLVEEKYAYLYDLGYVFGWCDVAKSLLSKASPSSSDSFDDSRFASRVDDLLDETQSEVSSSSWNDYLDSARISKSKKHYVAALYDLTFAKTMDQVDKDLLAMSSSDVENSARSSTTYAPKSLFAKVYFSQGKYLYEQKDFNGAYRMFAYAHALDSLKESIRSTLAKDADSSVTISVPSKNDDVPSSCLLSMILLSSLVVVLWKH